MPPDIATVAQWIGDDARKAEDAYAQGDYDLLKACLEAIQAHAQDLGDNPETTTLPQGQ